MGYHPQIRTRARFSYNAPTHQVSSSYVYSFETYRDDKQTNKQTNKQTPLKTSNALRYATTFGKDADTGTCLGKISRRCTSSSSVSMLLMTLLQLLAAMLLVQTADRRDVTGDEADDDDDQDDAEDDGIVVSRDVDASDSELE